HDAWHFCAGLGLDGPATFLGLSPLHHAYGGLALHAALSLGGTLVALPRFLPGPAIEAAARDRPAVVVATPPVIDVLGAAALAPGEERVFEGLRACVCSAGRLGAAAHARFVARFGVPVRVQYGSTETLSATVDLDDGIVEGRAGRPYPEVEVAVFDDDGAPCAPGRAGSIGVRSPAASAGYVDDPESTRRAFRGGFVFPGDRGRIDEGGVLHLEGRLDVIEIGGAKVDPLEVEAAIRAALPVRDVVVLETRRGGLPALRAVVEGDPTSLTPALVIARCRERLSPHKVPAEVEVRERLRRDSSGKVLRPELGSPA
ncbi:MAG TPA: fatty acid--CoA ligase family protein, partial [Planctomycetota bacterium]|nr:fatty acid--CoA ligase family protein [Planctomycetota bacterium]